MSSTAQVPAELMLEKYLCGYFYLLLFIALLNKAKVFEIIKIRFVPAPAASRKFLQP